MHKTGRRLLAVTWRYQRCAGTAATAATADAWLLGTAGIGNVAAPSPSRPSASHSWAGENWKWKRQPALSRRRIFFFPGRANFTSPTRDPASGTRNRTYDRLVANLVPSLAALVDSLGHRLFSLPPQPSVCPFAHRLPIVILISLRELALNNRNHGS